MISLPQSSYPESNEVDFSDDSDDNGYIIALPQMDTKAREERAEKRKERKISDDRLARLESLVIKIRNL